MKLMKSNPIFHGATAVTLALILLVNASFSSCFVLPSALSNNVLPRSAVNSLCVTTHRMKTEVDGMEERESKIGNSFEVVTTTNDKFIRGGIASMVAMGVVLTLGISAPAFADEYGRESEAQFLSTGETVMICTKRGPLGACTKTERRTVENENDKSEKYFKQPTELVIRKDNEARASDSTEGNELIARLKKQSEENFEKNEALVFQRTQLNDSVSPTTFCVLFIVLHIFVLYCIFSLLSFPLPCFAFVLFSLHSFMRFYCRFVLSRNCLFVMLCYVFVMLCVVLLCYVLFCFMLVCKLWPFRWPGTDSERRWERVFPSDQSPSHAIEEGWIYRKQEIY